MANSQDSGNNYLCKLMNNDQQPRLSDYWTKTQELNYLPAFEGKDRRNWGVYLGGLEETSERLLRYIIQLEKRVEELENK